MAVGYYSGSSTGPNDLIDKLRIALLAESFTVDDFSAVGAGYRLHVHKTLGGEVCYFNFRSAIAETGSTLITEDNYGSSQGTVTGLVINGSTGYDVGQDWDTQTGYPQNRDNGNKSYGVVMSPMSTSAIPAYYFYFVGNSVHIAVEITAGKFQFMSFGMLVKEGTITGDWYFTGSLSSYQPSYDYTDRNDVPRYFAHPCLTNDCVNGAVYINADGTTNWRMAGYDGSYDEIAFSAPAGVGNEWAYPYYYNSGMASLFYSYAPNAYNAMAAMCPLYVFLKRSDNNYSQIGYPEGVRCLNVTNYDPAEEIPYGDETWMVFPQDGVEDDPQNANLGVAFLKDDGS